MPYNFIMSYWSSSHVLDLDNNLQINMSLYSLHYTPANNNTFWCLVQFNFH
jgi:hypothetical protein